MRARREDRRDRGLGLAAVRRRPRRRRRRRPLVPCRVPLVEQREGLGLQSRLAREAHVLVDIVEVDGAVHGVRCRRAHRVVALLRARHVVTRPEAAGVVAAARILRRLVQSLARQRMVAPIRHILLRPPSADVAEGRAHVVRMRRRACTCACAGRLHGKHASGGQVAPSPACGGHAERALSFPTRAVVARQERGGGAARERWWRGAGAAMRLARHTKKAQVPPRAACAACSARPARPARIALARRALTLKSSCQSV